MGCRPFQVIGCMHDSSCYNLQSAVCLSQWRSPTSTIHIRPAYRCIYFERVYFIPGFILIPDGSAPSADHTELFSLPLSHLNGGDVAYLSQAAAAVTAAMQKEKEGEFSGAIRGYRTAVDILITGVQGETTRRKDILVRCNWSASLHHVMPVPA